MANTRYSCLKHHNKFGNLNWNFASYADNNLHIQIEFTYPSASLLHWVPFDWSSDIATGS